DEPNTWEEAKNSSDSTQWRLAYKDELRSLKEMGVYKIVPRSDVPTGTKIHKGRPVFKIKKDKNGKI
ncbi:hypothetical protein F5050DRAFT_1557798, partial [Lentinula boryana]